MLVGVVGPLAAGKSTVVGMLREEGLAAISLSDFLRERAARRELEMDRDTLYSLANECRLKFGPAALMDEALNRIAQKEEDYVIDAIRNLAEVARLRTQKNVLVIGITADLNVRYDRARKRQKETGREENAATLGMFKAQEERENSDNPNKPQLHKVLGVADVVIQNDGTMADLKKQVLAAFRSFKEKRLPPSREP